MNAASDGATIILTRERRGWRDRARSYLVILDGAEVARVRRGQRVELAVTPGHHEVFLKISWCRSPNVAVVARAGEVIELFCAPGGPPAAALTEVLGGGETYIRLTRVQR